MLLVSAQEFERLPLRVHSLLAGVPLHDVSFVDLPRWRAGVTLQDFLRTGTDCLCTPPPLVRMLLDIRFFVRHFFDWDAGPSGNFVGKHSQHVLPTRIGRNHWPRPAREINFSVSSTALKMSSLLS